MKLFKKIVSILAALTVMSGAAVSAVYAVETDTKIQLAGDAQYRVSSGSFSTIEDTAEYLKEQIKLRNETVNITVPYSFDQAADVLVEIMDKAFAETGDGSEGDYIRFGIHGYECSYSGNSARVTFNIKFNYFTTGVQERLVDEKIESVLGELDLTGKSDYEKIEIIYDYIVNNVSYAYDSSEDVIFSAYSALFNGSAVCQGIAQLFYRLATEAGISCRIISGTANGGNHAWNIAEINGKYYLLDPTFDLSYGGSEKYYFLRGSGNFDEHNKTAPHIAGSGKENNYAYAPDYTSAEFAEKYPVSQTDYDPENDKITYNMGDINGDGAVDGIDATLVLRAYTMIIADQDCPFNDEQMIAANINGDSIVDGVDATHILRYYTLRLSGYDNLSIEEYQKMYLR